MSWHLQRWGILLIVMGGLAFVLPLIGVQFRIFSITKNPEAAALIALGIGAVMAVLGTIGQAAGKSGAPPLNPPSAPAISVPPPAPPPLPAAPPTHCSRCGAALAVQARFCASCGTAVGAPVSYQMAPPPPQVTITIPPMQAPPGEGGCGGCLAKLLVLLAVLASAWFLAKDKPWFKEWIDGIKQRIDKGATDLKHEFPLPSPPKPPASP